jgi:tetratricopeptide (TPR) repeat protein
MVVVKYPTCRWVDDALFMMGSSYYYKGDYSRALEKLDYLILNYPTSRFYTDALYYKGLSYYKQQKYGAAIVALKEAAESKRFRKRAMIALCYVYNREGNYVVLTEVAQNLMRESLSTKERQELLTLLSEAQSNQKLYSDALATYNKMLSFARTREDKQKLKLKIAEIYLEMGEYEACKDFLEGENDDEFKNLLADLNVKLGDKARAKEIYHDVAKSSSAESASRAFYKLAELYENEDSLKLATAYYDSSIYKSPISDHGTKAKRKGDILKRIVGLLEDSENPDRARFLLAEIYFTDLKETERAIAEYQKVYESFPDSKWAPKALYAQFWITKNILKNDSLADISAQELITKYPYTEYVVSVKKILEEDTNKDE